MSQSTTILPISLHETWPGVPGPSCLGPWTGNQVSRAPDHRARTYVLPSALPGLSWCWMVLLGARSVDQGPTAGVTWPIFYCLATGRWTSDHGHRVSDTGALVLGT